MKHITCCLGCADRYPACHSSCEIYKEQKKGITDVNRYINHSRHNDRVATDVQYSGLIKSRKRK